MALGLYSSSLCGIVILTPSGSVQANLKIIKNFQMSTEFHFDEVIKLQSKSPYNLQYFVRRSIIKLIKFKQNCQSAMDHQRNNAEN